MRRVFSQLVLVVVVVHSIMLGVAWAQTSWLPPPSTNLQVVPKNVSADRLLQMMGGFASALGVRCQHCHAFSGSNSDDLAAYDFAADVIPAKAVARKMIVAVQTINADLLREIGEPRPAGQLKVGCYTCHRGERKPRVSPAQ